MTNEEQNSLLKEDRQENSSPNYVSCEISSERHCITCSDQLLLAYVLRIDQETQCALVLIKDMTEEIDVSLVEAISPGDSLLVHGGVAIARVA